MIRNKFIDPGYFLLPMALLLFSCQAEEEEPATDSIPVVRPVKLYYENSTGELASTTYFYDISGKNYLAHWQLEDSSRSSVNHYEYDSLGNQSRKYREYSDGTTSDQHFYYDTKGYIIKQEFSRSDGVMGETTYELTERLEAEELISSAATMRNFRTWERLVPS